MTEAWTICLSSVSLLSLALVLWSRDRREERAERDRHRILEASNKALLAAAELIERSAKFTIDSMAANQEAMQQIATGDYVANQIKRSGILGATVVDPQSRIHAEIDEVARTLECSPEEAIEYIRQRLSANGQTP